MALSASRTAGDVLMILLAGRSYYRGAGIPFESAPDSGTLNAHPLYAIERSSATP